MVVRLGLRVNGSAGPLIQVKACLVVNISHVFFRVVAIDAARDTVGDGTWNLGSLGLEPAVKFPREANAARVHSGRESTARKPTGIPPGNTTCKCPVFQSGSDCPPSPPSTERSG